MILWSSELNNISDFGLFQLRRKGQCCIDMRHMPVWAVRVLRFPSRRLWRCLAVLGGQGFHSIQHYFEMWYLYFPTPQLPVSAFLSPLLHSTLFSLWYRLFQSQNTFPTIPSCSGLVLILRELSSFKISFGMKNMENSTFRGTASFTNPFWTYWFIKGKRNNAVFFGGNTTIYLLCFTWRRSSMKSLVRFPLFSFCSACTVSIKAEERSVSGNLKKISFV